MPEPATLQIQIYQPLPAPGSCHSFSLPDHRQRERRPIRLVSYRITGEEIEITNYPKDAVGAVEIPAEIDGKPVTSIGSSAFYGCSRLAHLSLPSSLTHIHSDYGLKYAFETCHELAAIDIAPGNPIYSSQDGALFTADRSELIFCPAGRAGSYSIPAGTTTIGLRAFDGCDRLSSISIPSSLVEIVGYVNNGFDMPRPFTKAPFYGCRNLQAFVVDPQNPQFSSRDGVLFDAAMTTLIRFPEGKAGVFRVPANVVFGRFIDGGARGGSLELPFENCRLLERLIIPTNRNYFGSEYFQGCECLSEIVFLGDAPALFDWPEWSVPDFNIYYLSGSTGFTSPTWNGYPAIMIDEALDPAAAWLLSHGLAYDAELHQDLNGDGVSLLMAYALGLDPHRNLRSSFPAPVLSEDSLSISFHGASPGVIYRVETSTDLVNWTSDGVILSDLGADNRRTASVGLGESKRFLRLVVSEAP